MSAAGRRPVGDFEDHDEGYEDPGHLHAGDDNPNYDPRLSAFFETQAEAQVAGDVIEHTHTPRGRSADGQAVGG